MDFSLTYLRKRYGLNRDNALWNTYCPVHADELRRMYAVDKLSTCEIAEHCALLLGRSVCDATVIHWLKMLCVQIRSAKYAKSISVSRGRAKRPWDEFVKANFLKAALEFARSEKGRNQRKRNVKFATKQAAKNRLAERLSKACKYCGTVFKVAPSGFELITCVNCRRKCNCAPRGVSHAATHLSEWDVFDIRNLYVQRNISQKALANQYGIGEATVHAIIHRKSWSHITVPSTPRPDPVPTDAIARNPELAVMLGITPDQLNSKP